MNSALCVYVPENDYCDTTYVHFYLDELDAAESTCAKFMALYPSVRVSIFERQLCSDVVERVEVDRPLR